MSRATQTLCLKPRQPFALTSKPTRFRSGIGRSIVESPIAIGGGPLWYGSNSAFPVCTCPQPNPGTPAAIAAVACQRPIRVSAAAASPALVLTPGSLLEVLRVGALDLRAALPGVDGGVVLAAPGGGAPPSARPASFRSCDLSGKQQHLGSSYVSSLQVQGVSCAKAEKVIKAYRQCRHASGGPAGHCATPVLGFNCKDGRRTG